MADIIIQADQLPAFITVPAFATVEFFGADGHLHGHMNVPRSFVTKPLISKESADCCPITAKITEHEDLSEELDGHLPAGIQEAK